MEVEGINSKGGGKRGVTLQRLLMRVKENVPCHFICPLSGRILDHPVVDPDDESGRAVDRQAFEEHQTYHGVRPLTGLAPIPTPDTLEALATPVAAFLSDLRKVSWEQAKSRPDKQQRMSAGNSMGQQRVSAPHAPIGKPAQPPEMPAFPLDGYVRGKYFCPLSRACIRDLVVDRRCPNESCWERSAITDYILEHGCNPLTGEAMELRHLQPLPNLSRLVVAKAPTPPQRVRVAMAWAGGRCVPGGDAGSAAASGYSSPDPLATAPAAAAASEPPAAAQAASQPTSGGGLTSGTLEAVMGPSGPSEHRAGSSSAVVGAAAAATADTPAAVEAGSVVLDAAGTSTGPSPQRPQSTAAAAASRSTGAPATASAPAAALNGRSQPLVADEEAPEHQVFRRASGSDYEAPAVAVVADAVPGEASASPSAAAAGAADVGHGNRNSPPAGSAGLDEDDDVVIVGSSGAGVPMRTCSQAASGNASGNAAAASVAPAGFGGMAAIRVALEVHVTGARVRKSCVDLVSDDEEDVEAPAGVAPPTAQAGAADDAGATTSAAKTADTSAQQLRPDQAPHSVTEGSAQQHQPILEASLAPSHQQQPVPAALHLSPLLPQQPVPAALPPPTSQQQEETVPTALPPSPPPQQSVPAALQPPLQQHQTVPLQPSRQLRQEQVTIKHSSSPLPAALGPVAAAGARAVRADGWRPAQRAGLQEPQQERQGTERPALTGAALAAQLVAATAARVGRASTSGAGGSQGAAAGTSTVGVAPGAAASQPHRALGSAGAENAAGARSNAASGQLDSVAALAAPGSDLGACATSEAPDANWHQAPVRQAQAGGSAAHNGGNGGFGAGCGTVAAADQGLMHGGAGPAPEPAAAAAPAAVVATLAAAAPAAVVATLAAAQVAGPETGVGTETGDARAQQVQTAGQPPPVVATGPGAPAVALAPASLVAPALAPYSPPPGPLPATKEKLQAWLTAAVAVVSPAGACGGSADGNTSATVVLDLGGGTLEGELVGRLLRLPVCGPGRSVELRNGALRDICVLVEAGAVARLIAVDVVGRPGKALAKGTFSAVVTASGPGSCVTLVKSTVEATGSAGKGGCVLAIGGGSAELRGDCKLSGAPCFGLAASGRGSTVVAEDTTARGNGVAGFLAILGGHLAARRCTAEYNGNSTTWLATPQESHVGDNGFAALDGGTISAGDGCRAISNNRHGFFALGAGSKVTVGAKCIADSNGWGGFVAEKGGALAAGEECSASRNGRVKPTCHNWGFAAAGTGSELRAGAGCRAEGNKAGGFTAWGGGILIAGPSCVARSNALDGFHCKGQNSRLKTGVGSIAVANNERGFLAVGGARMVLGQDCKALDNFNDGVTAHSLAIVTLGHGCSAKGNKSDGIAVALGGILRAPSGGCTAEANSCHGWCAEDAGSKLEAGPGCKALANVRAGFRVAGKGAAMELGTGWVAAGNMQGELREDDGGQLVAMPPAAATPLK